MHIHILGIAGQGMTTPLALELKRLGHLITGSDQKKIYPPALPALKRARIPVNTPHPRPDLVIVGSSYKNIPKTREEFNQIKKLKIPYISATQYLASHLIKKNSIIVAGSFGKTTITALIAWILLKTNLKPSYLIGGCPINRLPSLKINFSDWSVVEGDESINGLDTKAKFLYYPPKYVLLTSADWEHKESYQTEADNLAAYRRLLQNIPQNGFLVYNPRNSNITKILPFCRAKTVPYDFNLQFPSPLIGQHNQENIIAAATFCRQLKIPDSTILSAVKSFKGIARRLQLLKNTHQILFVDDFAQSADRIKLTLKAISHHYPHRPIKVYFEPHASFLKYPSGLVNLKQAFTPAIEIVLGKINFDPKINKNDRVTAHTFATQVGNKLKYMPLPSQIIAHYQQTLIPGDVLVHLSSGGLIGLQTLHQIIRHFTP